MAPEIGRARRDRTRLSGHPRSALELNQRLRIRERGALTGGEPRQRVGVSSRGLSVTPRRAAPGFRAGERPHAAAAAAAAAGGRPRSGRELHGGGQRGSRMRRRRRLLPQRRVRLRRVPLPRGLARPALRAARPPADAAHSARGQGLPARAGLQHLGLERDQAEGRPLPHVDLGDPGQLRPCGLGAKRRTDARRQRQAGRRVRAQGRHHAGQQPTDYGVQRRAAAVAHAGRWAHRPRQLSARRILHGESAAAR
eukprot:COSAG04_NODE_1556_length_6361_cov_2.767167_2_plen_253_part_00